MKLLIALALAAAPSVIAMAPYVPVDEGPTAAPTLDPTPGPTPQPTPGPTPFELPVVGPDYEPQVGGEGSGSCDSPGVPIEFVPTGSCFPFEGTTVYSNVGNIPPCIEVNCGEYCEGDGLCPGGIPGDVLATTGDCPSLLNGNGLEFYYKKCG